MEVVLVRHGETEWSRTLKHTGWTDEPLTDLGREQASRVGAALSGREFALVLTSPLRRASETCSFSAAMQPSTPASPASATTTTDVVRPRTGPFSTLCSSNATARSA